MGAGVAWGIRNATTGVPREHAFEREDLHDQRPIPERHALPRPPPTLRSAFRRPACSNHENPNFQPTGVATLAGGQIAPIQPPNDGFFEAVTFHWRGAAGAGRQLDDGLDLVPAAVRFGILAAVIVTAACSAPAEPTRSIAAPLSNTFESPEALARAVLDALEQKDLPACARCRCRKRNFAITSGRSCPPAVPSATCRSTTPGGR